MQGSNGGGGYVVLGLAALIGCVAEAPREAPRVGPLDEEPIACGLGEADCPPGYVCHDDPDDDCDPEAQAVCPGLCQSVKCAGLLGLLCPAGQTCIDDPSDACDPRNGGADCGGLCVDEAEPTEPAGPRVTTLPLGNVVPPRCDDPARSYVSHEPALCGQVLFLCAEGWLPFYDACGCGCVLS